MLKDVLREFALAVKEKAGDVADALAGAEKTHVVSERAEVFRIPMPDGVPILARVTTKEMRRTWDALKDPHRFVAHEICTADRRGNTIHNGTGSLAEVLGYFIRKATDGFYDIRVQQTALSCSECGGCGIIVDDRCKVCDGTGMRPQRECIRHIALSLQKSVPVDDHDALLHVAMSAMRETDEFYQRICEQWKAHEQHELLDAMRACVVFYLGALARVTAIGPAPAMKNVYLSSFQNWRSGLMERAAKAAGTYASMVLSQDASLKYHRSESARFMVLMGLESKYGGLTVDKLGMTIFTEIRPDGSVNVQDAWSPEFFRRNLADMGARPYEDMLSEYCDRVREVTWAIESTAQKAGMLPGESLASFIERLRTERNEAQDKLAEALETLNG